MAHFVSITVHVGDVNDWIPNFENSNYNFIVQEDTMPGTIIGQVTAFDQDKKVLSSFYVDSLRKDIFLFQDPNNRIRYRLVSAGGLEQHFSVNPETGLITLALQVDAFAGEKITVSCKCIKTLGRYIETPGSEGRTFCSISTKYETGKFLRMGKFFLV